MPKQFPPSDMQPPSDGGGPLFPGLPLRPDGTLPTIYALKAADEEKYIKRVRDSLDRGEGRFGWGHYRNWDKNDHNGDLDRIRDKIDQKGWGDLSDHERDCWGKANFLLGLKEGDWVVYINVPSYGRCTMARVLGEKPYCWKDADEDFNHHFQVDPETIEEFDRNDACVHPALGARLRLQGAWWRIYTLVEFGTLRVSLAEKRAGKTRTLQDTVALLGQEIQPQLLEITRRIQRTHPNYGLELLLEQVFKAMPGVREVIRQGGAGDHGADLIVRYESGLPIPVLQSSHTCLVQVKSYVGEHHDIRAVDDLRRAFMTYPEADIGLIISTAEVSTACLDDAIKALREETGKRVELMIGADVARFVLGISNGPLGR